ncbi:MAG: ComEA family DNA-binding protein [Bacteroidota bacterium]
MKTFCLLAVTFLFVLEGIAQTHLSDMDPTALDADMIADHDLNYEGLLENYIHVHSLKVDLNRADKGQLRALQCLNEQQINNLLRYREENGKLISIYELQCIDDFDLATIYALLPLVDMEDPSLRVDHSVLKKILYTDNMYVVARYERILESSRGFHESDSLKRFVGSPGRYYLRFRSNRPGDFSIGLTGENDPGEPLQWQPSRKFYGFDHLSFHTQLMNKGKLKNLLIGDYQPQFSQGLLLGAAAGFGKGSQAVTTAHKSVYGFVPYSSAQESGFFRGVAITYDVFQHTSISGFYSRLKQDAGVNQDSENPSFSSLNVSGLHRNEGELAHRKNVAEKNIGFIIHHRRSSWDAGLIFNHTHLSVPISRSGSNIHQQFSFEGDDNSNLGAFINCSIDNIRFFGEVGKSVHAGVGAIAGLLASFGTAFDMAMVWRKYDKDFYSFHTNALSESTQPQNESGIYWGWSHRWNRRYTMTGYADLFRFPWIRFRNYKPSHGHEWLLRFNYQPSRKVLCFLQAREEVKTRNTNDVNTNLYHTDKGTKRNYWISVDFGIAQHLRLKTRCQFSTYNINKTFSQGLLLLQDLTFHYKSIELTLRHALFDTDNYDNRHYVYENDVWLAYALPALDGMGIRNYAMIEFKANKHLSFWFRYARTRYTNQTSIGSDVDLIEGNTRNDIKFQTRWRL